MELAIGDDGCAQDDACVHAAIGTKIANAAAIYAAAQFFQLVDYFHGADFWGARDRACGKAAGQSVQNVIFFVENAHNIGDDVHDVGIIFKEEFVGDGHAADLGDAANVVAAQIKQHKIRNGTLVEDDSAADMTTWARLSDLRQKKLAMMKLTDEETVEYKTLKKAYKQSKQEGQTAAAESHSTEVPVEVAQS